MDCATGTVDVLNLVVGMATLRGVGSFSLSGNICTLGGVEDLSLISFNVGIFDAVLKNFPNCNRAVCNELLGILRVFVSRSFSR